jgi:hypothetical protein
VVPCLNLLNQKDTFKWRASGSLIALFHFVITKQ